MRVILSRMQDSEFDSRDRTEAAEWVTTTTLLARLLDYDDSSAWERLVARFREPVARFARAMGVDPSACEDVAQDALLAFAESFRKGAYDRSKGRLSSWLFGFAHRQALAHRRHEAHAAGAPRGESAETPMAGEPAIEQAWDQIWEHFLLDRALMRARRQFSPETYTAFERVALQDQSPHDVATALGIPVKAVYNAKHRVLQRIRELMTDLEALPES